MNDEINAADKEDAVFSHISISQETAEKIQMNTAQQSQSAAWYNERQWRITASYFGQVCKMRKSTSPVRLATTITSQCQKQFVSIACSWGKDNQSNAIVSYARHYKERGKEVTVKQTGLVINPDFPYLGASPRWFSNRCY